MATGLSSMDLSKYLRRLGIEVLVSADLENLAAIQLAHMRAISFENLDVVCKKAISMEVEDVCAKLLDAGRGGYCFEQNTLLLAALRAVGFTAKPVLARVLWNRPPGYATPFTHMSVIVSIGTDEYLVDVGFGGLSSLVPVLIHADCQETTSCDGTFRVAYNHAEVDSLTLQWQLQDTWVDLYKFQNTEALLCDMMVANWWSCTWPGARWTTCMFVARIIGRERHHFLNDEYCARGVDGVAKRRKVSCPQEIMELLTSVFGLSLPTSGAGGAGEGAIGDALLASMAPFVKFGALPSFHNPVLFASR